MRRRTIALLGATAAAVAAAGGLWFQEIDRRWKKLDERVNALQARLETVEIKRPVLYGTAIQGDAWTAYESAISLARTDKSLEELVRPSVRESLKPEVLERLLAAHAGTLEQLHRGAHCVEARSDVDWSWKFSAEDQPLLVTRGLANLAVAHSLSRIASGRPVEAVETLLDAAQLGRDLMHSHLLSDEMVGSAVLAACTFGATETNQLLDRLPPEALRRFAEGLAILDQSLAEMGPSFHREAVLFARSLQGDPTHPEQTAWSIDAWRYGFSNRMMRATMGLKRLDLVERVTAAAAGWSACEKYFSHQSQKDATNSNLRDALLARFETIARLRLLRMAIDYTLGRTIIELPDPFGNDLQHAIDSEGKARFWSTGPEGKQDLFLFPNGGS